MPLEPVLCSQCGAPLEVPADVQFVTCKQCGVGLRVKHDATVAYTEVIDKLARTTDQLSDHLAALRHEQQLERIDREWERERQSLMSTSKRGDTYVPTVASGVLAIVIGGGVGIAWTMMAGSMGAPFFFPLFGIVFVILAVGLGLATISKAQQYQRAEETYRRRRAEAERHDND